MIKKRGKKIQGVAILCVLSLSMVFFLNFPQKARAGLANHLVINQIQIDSRVGAGGTEDDWVELFNPTSTSINLSGWSIQKASSNGATSSPFREALGGIVPANGFFLIVRNNALTSASLKGLADYLSSDSFTLAAGNIISLVNDNNAILDYSDTNIVDYVGFGTAKFHEGSLSALAIPEGKGIRRVNDGEDTDQNGNDFIVENFPSPRNSKTNVQSSSNEVLGKVLLTLNTPGEMTAYNVLSNQASFMFETNTEAISQVAYGLDSSYTNFSSEIATEENIPANVTINNLLCGTTYHYSIQAVTGDELESDASVDRVFTTLSCGLALENIVMTKSTARANNSMTDGWEWKFNITVSKPEETSLKMKFDSWTGNSILNAASNMQYSIDNGVVWSDIIINGEYPANGLSIVGLDNNVAIPGRQIEIIVRMKLPFGTIAGFYKSNFGILTE